MQHTNLVEVTAFIVAGKQMITFPSLHRMLGALVSQLGTLF